MQSTVSHRHRAWPALGLMPALLQATACADSGSLAAQPPRRVGAEYRAKPDKLNPSALGAGLQEDDWSDVFIAWAPNKNVSLTLAWVELGRIVPAVVARRQHGAYLSAQLAF